jgi:hypothetical protein
MRTRCAPLLAACIGLSLGAAACATPPPPPPPPATPVVQTDPASLGVENTLGNSAVVAGSGSVSLDGRFVVFPTTATNVLVPSAGGAPDCCKLYLRDRQEGTVQYIGRGKQGHISGNGRYVAFKDLDNAHFVWDRVTDTRRPFGYNGQLLPGVGIDYFYPSDNGESVVYGSNNNPFAEQHGLCRVHDFELNTDTACLGTESMFGEGYNFLAASRNTRFVLYSDSPWGIFWGNVRLWDRTLNTLTTVPNFMTALDPGVAFGRTVSNDGRYLIGSTTPPDGIPAVVDLQAIGGPAVLQMPGSIGPTQPVDMSPDARFVQVIASESMDPADTDTSNDAYLWDRSLGTVKLASKHIEDGTNSPDWVSPCRQSPGAMTASGDSCITTAASLVGYDTNGFTDHYVLRRP